jgi:hypothetical protein
MRLLDEQYTRTPFYGVARPNENRTGSVESNARGIGMLTAMQWLWPGMIDSLALMNCLFCEGFHRRDPGLCLVPRRTSHRSFLSRVPPAPSSRNPVTRTNCRVPAASGPAHYKSDCTHQCRVPGCLPPALDGRCKNGAACHHCLE